jgi:hypothetical protein
MAAAAAAAVAGGAGGTAAAELEEWLISSFSWEPTLVRSSGACTPRTRHLSSRTPREGAVLTQRAPFRFALRCVVRAPVQLAAAPASGGVAGLPPGAVAPLPPGALAVAGSGGVRGAAAAGASRCCAAHCGALVPDGRLTKRARACAQHLAAMAVALTDDEGVLRRYCQARRRLESAAVGPGTDPARAEPSERAGHALLRAPLRE